MILNVTISPHPSYQLWLCDYVSQDLRSQPFKPCVTLPINTGCVNPLAVQGVLTPLNARKRNQPRVVPYQKSDLCMRIRELAHTFHAQPLMCIPARLDPSPVTGYLTCSTSMPRFNATTCLLHMTPYRYVQAATDGNPQRHPANPYH